MKSAALAALFLVSATLGASAYPWKVPIYGLNPGNPDHDAYAGEPGSVYDMAANPPRDAPPATYNPQAPLPPSPTTQTLPPMTAPMPPMAAPLPPVR